MVQNREIVRRTLSLLINEWLDNIAEMEMLKLKIAKLESQVAIAESERSLLEPDVCRKMTAIKEMESRRKFLSDSIGHYEKRLSDIIRGTIENLRKQTGPSTARAGPSNRSFGQEPAGEGKKPEGIDSDDNPGGALAHSSNSFP